MQDTVAHRIALDSGEFEQKGKYLRPKADSNICEYFGHPKHESNTIVLAANKPEQSALLMGSEKITLQDFADYVGVDLDDYKQKRTSTIHREVQEYWKSRGIHNLPASISSNTDTVFYNTYPDTETEQPVLFQYSKIGEWKRMNRSNNSTEKRKQEGKAVYEGDLYIPHPWNYYKGRKFVYLVEGIPDCLTHLECGNAAIAARYDNAVSKDKFEDELIEFLKFTETNLIVIPDPGTYQLWYEKLEVHTRRIIDINLWFTDGRKTDSNDLYQHLGFDHASFKQALNWLRKQTTTTFKKIYENEGGSQILIRDYHNKQYRLKTTTNKKDETPEVQNRQISNFLFCFRKFYRDFERDARREMTFLFENSAETKLVSTSNTGEYSEFKKIAHSVYDNLWIDYRHYRMILGNEIELQQFYKQIECRDWVGSINDIVLFKNLGFKNGKMFKSNSMDILNIDGQQYQTHMENAPSLQTKSEPGISTLFLEMLIKAFGDNAVFSLAFILASVRMKPVIEMLNSHPLLYLRGEPGSGKSSLLRVICRLFGITEALSNQDTRPSLERKAQKYHYLPVPLNEFSPVNEMATEFLVNAYDRKMRGRAHTDNTLRTHSNAFNPIICVTSNYAVEGTHPLDSRNVYLGMDKSGMSKVNIQALTKLSEESDIAVQLYQTDLDIKGLFSESQKAVSENTENADPRLVNNYSVVHLGLVIMEMLELLSELKLNRYEKQLWKTIKQVLEENKTENLVDKWLKDMHYLILQYESIREGIHYKIDRDRDRLAIVGNMLFNAMRDRHYSYDQQLVRQALQNHPYTIKTSHPITFKGKLVKCIVLKLSAVESNLELSFENPEPTAEIVDEFEPGSLKSL